MSIKCDWCGKFIAYEDLANGDAFVAIEPSSALGVEKIENTCRRCVLPPKRHDRDGTRSAETACPAPVPQDCQARADGIAKDTPDTPSSDRAGGP